MCVFVFACFSISLTNTVHMIIFCLINIISLAGAFLLLISFWIQFKIIIILVQRFHMFYFSSFALWSRLNNINLERLYECGIASCTCLLVRIFLFIFT